MYYVLPAWPMGTSPIWTTLYCACAVVAARSTKMVEWLVSVCIREKDTKSVVFCRPTCCFVTFFILNQFFPSFSVICGIWYSCTCACLVDLQLLGCLVPARPRDYWGKSLTRNIYASWSGLILTCCPGGTTLKLYKTPSQLLAQASPTDDNHLSSIIMAQLQCLLLGGGYFIAPLFNICKARQWRIQDI